MTPARGREWPALLAIIGVFAVGWLLVGPRANVPVIDDWVYAWSVEHLLATGRLQVLEFSAVYPIAQILWGALFTRVLGFSFGVLRLSTLALAVIGCWAIYLTLRELGCRRAASLLGALALALDPVYFALSFSFMTEVPFAGMSAVTLYCFVRALRRNSTAFVWAGALFSVAAFLVRPLGLALPLAMLPAAMWTRDWKPALRRRALPVAAALTAMVVLQVTLPRVLGPLDWAAIRQSYLQWWFLVPIGEYARWNLNVLTVGAFPFVPLLVPLVVQRRHALLTAGAAVLLGVVCWRALGGLSMPIPDWETWSLQEITARSLIGGTLTPSDWSLRLTPVVKIVGLIAFGSLAVIGLRGAFGRPRWGRAEVMVATLAVLHLAAIHVLWLYNDRYYITLAPALAIIGAQALDRDRLAQWGTAALLVVWAAVGISGTRDMLAFNDTCARVTKELEASGIPPWDIDAGYSLNGWRLYAHPENLRPGTERRYGVPFVTSKEPTQYSLTNTPPPGSEVLRTVRLDRATWQATRMLYVVRRPLATR